METFQLLAYLPGENVCLVKKENGEIVFCYPLREELSSPQPDYAVASACAKYGYAHAEPSAPMTMDELKKFVAEEHHATWSQLLGN